MFLSFLSCSILLTIRVNIIHTYSKSFVPYFFIIKNNKRITYCRYHFLSKRYPYMHDNCIFQKPIVIFSLFFTKIMVNVRVKKVAPARVNKQKGISFFPSPQLSFFSSPPIDMLYGYTHSSSPVHHLSFENDLKKSCQLKPHYIYCTMN